ncbi:MAG TPA: DUF885 family protein, partial [Candidatus Limnocylindria bacterium]|nr:DUF885 family protein [Candidatus Limnocylindria bacterium]
MQFRALVDDLLDAYFGHYPVHATEIGNHDHDGAWPDLTAAGGEARLAWLTHAIGSLQSLDEGALSRDERIDRRILLQNLEALEFGERTLDEESWNPLTYVYLFGNGLFSLLAREFAPVDVRLRSAAERLRGLPAALDQARARLNAGGARQISQFHAQKAVERMPGLTDLADTAVEESSAVDDALRAEVAA